jgi:hypothetical protein
VEHITYWVDHAESTAWSGRWPVLPATRLDSLCNKTPNTALFSFLKQSFTKCKLLGFKNFESIVFGVLLSKTRILIVSLRLT